MNRQSSVWGKLRALAQGEISADNLVAYRRAGSAVYDLLDQVEARRLDMKIRGVDPWTAEPGVQAEMLCAWNAFALQTLGDHFLDADDEADPATAGYVPRVTAEQVMAFYRQVEAWLSRANQARSNPRYQIDVAVPAELPPWVAVEPCPHAHLRGILGACDGIQRFADAAVGVVQQSAPPERQEAAGQLRQILADASTKAAYAERLLDGSMGRMSQQTHSEIERSAKYAMAQYYLLGQLLAMPSLLERPRRSPSTAAATPAGTSVLPLPGQPGFDPWRLTDPATRDQWRHDPKARRAIENLWRNDPDPRRTLEIQAEIDAALVRGDIGYATDRAGHRIGHYYCCPWSPIYMARHPVTIGGRWLRPMDEFTFDVSAEGVPEGAPFKRDIVVATFSATADVDYCDPRDRT